MRTPVAIGTLILGATIAAGGQTVDQRLAGQLKRLFPDASAFSPKEGSPPHFKAFVSDPQTGARTVAGFAFWTTELEPLERGYDGPIKILVGVNPKGTLAGVVVVDHHEPYGYFSVDMPEFAAQFKDKDIRDAFKVGDDVDAVSRATMTVTSAARAIRNGSRRLASKLLTPPEKTP